MSKCGSTAEVEISAWCPCWRSVFVMNDIAVLKAKSMDRPSTRCADGR